MITMCCKKIAVLASVLVLIFLTACGGSSSGTDATQSGEVIIGLTDAEGDFLSYSVDVVSLRLIRQDGLEVETVPLTTRLDFAQYQDMTEFFTAATVPTGRYKAAMLTLDFSQADIQVEVDGLSVPAFVQDENGSPIGLMEFEINLAQSRPLRVAAGIPAHLTVDFDLQASNTVDTQVTPPLITVAPFLVADVNPSEPKPHRLRGLLREVDQEVSNFTLQVRPFHRRSGVFGRMRVYSSERTVYEIDGTVSLGEEGLASLATQVMARSVIVLGQLNMATRRFNAKEVYAGSSVPGSQQDVVRGSVLAREGDVFTVKGVTVMRANGSVIFNDTVTISMSDNTVVRKQGGTVTDLTKDAISVGQRIIAFGQLSEDDLGGLTLDATTGLVRMLLTQLSGEVVTVLPDELAMSLYTINGRPVSAFDFTGTGLINNDADPDNYQVATSTLTLEGLQTQDPIKVRGFVAPYGVAPADFEARSVIRVADVGHAVMKVRWQPANPNAFQLISETALTLDMAGVGQYHHVRRSGVFTDLLDFNANPELQVDGNKLGLFALRYGQSVHVFLQFSDFQAALELKLGQGFSVVQLTSKGRFDDETATLLTRHIKIILE